MDTLGCTEFFIDDPISAITNFKSLLPRQAQCINEKLNSLAFFSVLFSVFLWVMKVPFAWAFGVFGVLASIILKLVYFDGDNGQLTIEEYTTGTRIQNTGDLTKWIPNEPLNDEFQNLSDDVHFISTSPHFLDGITKDSTFEDIKDSVTTDLWRSRIPPTIPSSYMYGDVCIV